MSQIELYDTTLRDGSQREDISYSLEDKLKIARRLDQLGMRYIEGGWPGSNPKDAEFFTQARALRLKQAIITAFGSTRRANIASEHDANLQALLDADTQVVTLVGKTWDLHVTEVLNTTLEENLAMIADSIRYLIRCGRRVFYDAEHFFDGYRARPDYALQTLRAAAEAGAECIILCDTNGGSLPDFIARAVDTAKAAIPTQLGIHTHNDSELAVANSLIALQHGARQVQGTINGYGERCGNANLVSIIANLKLKMGEDVVSDEQLASLNDVSHYIAELANLKHDSHQAYVGQSAFAHKGGIHVAAMMKCEDSYQHIKPDLVGNKSRVLVSELSGRGNVLYKATERGLAIARDSDHAGRILEKIKELEHRGFQFESAEASFELLVRRAQPDYQPLFELVDFMVVVEKQRRPARSENQDNLLAEAMVKVRVNGELFHTAAEGNGPVNALDIALRKALVHCYPHLSRVRLTDYKVRILNEDAGTEARIRVLIDSTDGDEHWSTVGSSTNIVEASWQAVTDSLEYWLLKHSAVPVGAGSA